MNHPQTPSELIKEAKRFLAIIHKALKCPKAYEPAKAVLSEDTKVYFITQLEYLDRLFEDMKHASKQLNRKDENGFCKYKLLIPQLIDEINGELDLFEHFETLPKAVQKLIENEIVGYDLCKKLIVKLEKFGYTCTYGLDGSPIELKKL